MTIDSNAMDRTGGATAFGRGPPVVSIILESMVMVLDCPCLALEAQLIQNLLNKPLTKFGRWGDSDRYGSMLTKFQLKPSVPDPKRTKFREWLI